MADGVTALAVGAVTSAIMLVVFGVLGPAMTWGELMGQTALQTVPASIGAIVARKQMGQKTKTDRSCQGGTSYVRELFLMAAGALFLAFNVAPTEEMVLISYTMTP